MFMTDLAGVITSWNPGIERILGYTEDEFIGQHSSCIFTLEDRKNKQSEGEMETALKTEQAMDIRWHLKKTTPSSWQRE